MYTNRNSTSFVKRPMESTHVIHRLHTPQMTSKEFHHLYTYSTHGSISSKNGKEHHNHMSLTRLETAQKGMVLGGGQGVTYFRNYPTTKDPRMGKSLILYYIYTIEFPIHAKELWKRLSERVSTHLILTLCNSYLLPIYILSSHSFPKRQKKHF